MVQKLYDKNSRKEKTAFILAAAAIVISLLIKEPFSWYTVKFAILGWILLTVSIIDYRYLIIPDELLAAGIICYVSVSIMCGESIMQIAADIFLHGPSVALPLLLFVLVADWFTGKETMGFGDIKLFFLIGIYLGAAYTLLVLFLACVLALVLYAVTSQRDSGEPFPFGPSISAAVWITVLWGQPVLEWYMAFLTGK